MVWPSSGIGLSIFPSDSTNPKSEFVFLEENFSFLHFVFTITGSISCGNCHVCSWRNILVLIYDPYLQTGEGKKRELTKIFLMKKRREAHQDIFEEKKKRELTKIFLMQ